VGSHQVLHYQLHPFFFNNRFPPYWFVTYCRRVGVFPRKTSFTLLTPPPHYIFLKTCNKQTNPIRRSSELPFLSFLPDSLFLAQGTFFSYKFLAQEDLFYRRSLVFLSFIFAIFSSRCWSFRFSSPPSHLLDSPNGTLSCPFFFRRPKMQFPPGSPLGCLYSVIFDPQRVFFFQTLG